MNNIMNDLNAVGLNPFAVTLLAESMLKSPLAPMTVGKPQGFFYPVQRSDCAGWVGVRMTLEAVPENETDAARVTRADAPPSAAARDVLAERQRQIIVEGYTSTEDDANNDLGQLAQAAACYAAQGPWPGGLVPAHWPWSADVWKPKDYRSSLVKAGALILAEIERLDRRTAG